MKQCCRCDELKLHDSFNKRSSSSDGHRSECRDCQTEARRLYREQDVEAYNAKFREWARNNPEKRKAICKSWNQRNPDKVYANVKAFRSRNPNYANERAAIRRARVKDLPFEHVGTYLVYLMWKGVCGLCGVPVDKSLLYPDPESATVDHVIAIANGGPNLYENVQLAHARCNWKKNAR